jgi:hypothetical protein
LHLKDLHRSNHPYSHAPIAAPAELDPLVTPGEQPPKGPSLKTMVHGAKTENYIKCVHTEEERARSARKAAKRADVDEEKANKCVGELWYRRLRGKSARLWGWGQKLKGP